MLGDPDKLIVRLNENGFHWMFSDRTFLKHLYRYSTKNRLNLKNPTSFNEKLQWLKLYNRKPEYTAMVDKYEVKRYVADKIGEEYIIPTLGVWDKFDDIDFDALPDQFVLKCTHDSGGLVICRDKRKLNKKLIKKKIQKSLKRNYYWHNREWPYKNVKPRIIVEEYLKDEPTEAEKREDGKISCGELQQKHGFLDYKFMCFHGEVKALFLDIGVIGDGEGHAEEYYRNVYDREGNLMPVLETRENYPIEVELPSNLNEMVNIAEKLSEGIPHVRVDLYRLSTGQIKFGELTFFHGSGMSNRFIPEEWDTIFGGWITLPEKTTKA